jgi:hypothetical protein
MVILRVLDVPDWPPHWSGGFHGGLEFPQGEVGRLRVAVADYGERSLVLAIAHEGALATAVWPVPADLLEPLARLLRGHIGRAVAEIGELPLRTD